MYKPIFSLTLFIIFFNINTNAQVKEFKIIYGQKELIFHDNDTIEAKIFEADTIRIIPNLFNPINKYSFEGGQIIIKTIGNKAETKNDTSYFATNFETILPKYVKDVFKSRKVTQVGIHTNLKVTIANYKEEIKEFNLFFYLK